MELGIFFVGFAHLCRAMWMRYGEECFRNVPGNATVYTWVRYGLDNFLGLFLFDAPDIYGFKFTDIDHVRIARVSNIIFVFKIVVALMFVKYIILVWKSLRGSPTSGNA